MKNRRVLLRDSKQNKKKYFYKYFLSIWHFNKADKVKVEVVLSLLSCSMHAQTTNYYTLVIRLHINLFTALWGGALFPVVVQPKYGAGYSTTMPISPDRYPLHLGRVQRYEDLGRIQLKYSSRKRTRNFILYIAIYLYKQW